MAIDPNIQLPKGVDTFNEAFFDGLVRHQIGLLQLSGAIRNEIFRLLDATEKDMVANIKRILKKSRGFDSPRAVQRMNTLLRVLEGTRAKAWKEINADWVQRGIDISKAEPDFTNEILKMSVPVIIETVIPSAEFLGVIAQSRPFEGKVLKVWAAKQAADDLARISDAVKIGMIQGESSAAIARRVVGTRQAGGANGVTQLTRNAAAAVTRTMVNAMSNQARREFYKANIDVFPKELYVATLDSRTTAICKSLDGQQFPTAEGPIPPLHFNCRSLRVAVIDGRVVGNRPVREFTQRGLVREFSDGKFTSRASLPRGQKGKFDTWARIEMRKRTGTTPAKVSYQEWLDRQSPQFQNDVLGDVRGALFRRGGLPLTKFVDRGTFKEFTLEQLARRNRDAFIKANLNPDDF